MQKNQPFKIKSSAEITSVFDCARNWLVEDHKLFFSRQSITDLKTAFVEATANAIRHAQELDQFGCVEGCFFVDDQKVGFDVFDHGPGYDLLDVPIPDLADFSASGRGVFMMKQLGDDLSYQKLKTHNRLRFVRNLVGQNESLQGLDLLYELSEAIIRNATLDEVYQIILDQALSLFQVERASILIYDDTLKALKMVASRGIQDSVQNSTRVKSGEGVSGFVFQHGRSILIEDIERNQRGIEKKDHYKTGSFISAPMICSPLRLDEKPIGVINLTDRIDGKRFSRKDLKLLSTIANQAMACLYIRGLVDEIKQTENIRHEMQQVRVIQESYLPSKSPDLIGYSLFGRCEMAQSVGGDYYDFIKKGESLFLVVADVAGHNTSSAVTMVNVRAQLKAFLECETDPKTLLHHLNQSLYEDLSRHEQFVSCLLVRIELSSGLFTMSSAGHYAPVFNREVLSQFEPGLVLGVDRNEEYHNLSGQLLPSDRMILFTDGVIESVNDEEEFFGMKRLNSIVKESEGQEDLASHIVDEVLKFRGGKRPLDDVTVVALERLSP